jgi:hypothetical protein
MNDPSQIAGAGSAQPHLRCASLALVQQPARLAQGFDQGRLRIRVERRQQMFHPHAAAVIGGGEGGAAGFGEGEGALASRHLVPDQAAGAQSGGDARQMRLVHPELAAQFRRRAVAAGRQLINHAGLGQGQVGIGQMLVEQPDPPGIEAVEAADFRHGVHVFPSKEKVD